MMQSSVTLLACGMCVDHLLDWIAPFILPIFPVAVGYLLLRRALRMFPQMFHDIPQPSMGSLLLFWGVVIAAPFFTMGSLWVSLGITGGVALVNYIAVWIKVRQRASRIFQGVFLLLWLGAGGATWWWIRSESRMLYHLSYVSSFRYAHRYYEQHATRYADTIRVKLTSASWSPSTRLIFQYGSLFRLASLLQEPSLAPPIATLLVTYAEHDELYIDRLLRHGFAALQHLNPSLLVTTCQQILTLPAFTEKTADSIGYTHGKHFALTFGTLLQHGQPDNYREFMTREHVAILRKYRTGENDWGRSQAIEVEGGVDIDWEDFGGTPEPPLTGKQADTL